MGYEHPKTTTTIDAIGRAWAQLSEDQQASHRRMVANLMNCASWLKRSQLGELEDKAAEDPFYSRESIMEQWQKQHAFCGRYMDADVWPLFKDIKADPDEVPTPDPTSKNRFYYDL